MKKMINKLFNRETIVYVIFGILTTAVNYISYYFLRTHFGIPLLASNTVAWIISVLFAFITNKIIVFESRSFKIKILLYEFISFVGARVLSFLFEEGFLAAATHFGFNEYISKAAAGIIVIIINYFLSKFLIFNKNKKNRPTEDIMDNPDTIRKKHGTLQVIDDICHSRTVYLMAFIVPFIIMIAIYIMRKIYPFGSYMYLKSDMYHQYAPFFSSLWDKIKNGGSFQYSWDAGMGTNYLALFGYYLSCPFNWLVAFFPKSQITTFMDFMIVFKIALSSLTFTIYLCRHNHRKEMSAAIFGVFYALSGFVTAYSWNIMWLDCIILLPLVILGLENLVHEGRGLLYVVTLGISILSNYYISIMICLSMVIYFIVLMISRPVMEHKSEYIKSTLAFIGYSLLAGAFAAVLLLPEMAALEYTASGNVNFPKTLTRYFSFITMIKRQLINVDVHLGLDHYPNIYCGVAIFLLLPLYVMSPKISKREKAAKITALVIFLIAFNLNIPNFIWHGFHFPNSLPCRQSFIYIFILLTICYDAFKNIHKYTDKQLSGSLCGVLIFLVYLGNTLSDDDPVSFRSLYISAVFIALYIIIFFMMKKWKKYTSCFIIAVFAISIVEVTMNTEKTGYTTTSRTSYLRDNNGVTAVISDLEANDTGFYRLTKYTGYRSKNDATWHNFNSSSIFSSTAYAGLSRFYGQLGLEHSTNAYAIHGATPVVYSLFNVKYLLTNKHIADNDIFSYYSGSDGEFLYKNNYVLPVGFMVPSDLDWNIMYDIESNPFVVQNNFIAYATGIKDVLTPVDYSREGLSYTLTSEDGGFIYCYARNKTAGSVNVIINGISQTFSGINHGRGIDIGYVEPGSEIKISDSDNKNDLQLIIYTLNEEKYKEAIGILAMGGLEVTSHGDTEIKGTITASYDGLMFTSVPYDEGWTVYVDGVKTSLQKIGEAFIAVPVSAGTHTIEMKYQARNYRAGLVISIISLMIIAFLAFFRIKYKMEITESGAIKTFMESRKKYKTDTDSEAIDSENTDSENTDSENTGNENTGNENTNNEKTDNKDTVNERKENEETESEELK